MQPKRILITFLIVIPIIFGLLLSPATHSTIPSRDDSISSSGSLETNEVSKNNYYAISQDTQEGILNPNRIIQRGYQETNLVRARTDSNKNTLQNITIDNENDWAVSKAEVEVTNLRKIYAVNGTFDEEVDPWVGTTYDPSGGDQEQYATWNSTEGYVTCINYGEFTDKPVQDDTYTHYLDSEILWEQTVSNSPQTTNFSLSFRYRYVSGPVDPEPYDFSGDVQLWIYVHSDIYWMSIATGDLRGVWYSLTDYPIELVGAPTSFTVGIGLHIEYANLVLTENGDYDDDGYPDGLINAQKIEVNLDDFEFKSQTPIPFEDVDLTFNIGSSTASIIGPTGGVGTSIISNPSLWVVDPLQIEVTANNSVSFDYFVTSYFQRDFNSSWTTDLSENGVLFQIEPDQNADLEYYTYIIPNSDYENLTLEVQYPSDWENTTILDPLRNDITGLCTVSAGCIFVPNSLFSRVGWWKITQQAYNYAKEITIQILDDDLWTENSLFRPNNSTRVQVEIGTTSETPSSGSPVLIDWIMPNGTVWESDSISEIVGGRVNSSVWTFGGSNTTAGLWEVQVVWNNGTELAYGIGTFDLYHQASATVKYPTIETEYGLVLSNQITLIDSDTGKYLLDDSVSMTANWSETTVEFAQNFAKNWWQAEFDTALVQNGVYTVFVEISRPYFDSITTQFTITTIFETSLEILNAGSIPIERGLNEAFTVQLSYELWNGTGISGASPTITSTAPQEGIDWNTFVDNENGLYSINIISNISTTYSVTITFSKAYHYNASDSFTLTITKTSTELELVNGTADVVQYGDSYRLVLEYRNSTGQGLSGATVEIVTVTPGTGLSYGNFTPLYDGFYEVTFTPSTTGTFSIVITATIFNHETKFATFTLTGVVIPSILTALPSSAIIGVNQSYVVQLYFHDEDLNSINGAIITVLDPPEGISISTVIPAGNGLYNITVHSAAIDTYSLLFRASATNYQSSIVGFTVSVNPLQTDLEIVDIGAIPIEKGLNELLTVEFTYQLSNGTGIGGAELSLTYTGPENGLWENNFLYHDNGLYSVDITCNVSGTYGITITLLKPFHYNTSDYFILIIGETGSELDLLNGTADVVLFGNSYRLVLEYQNSTGFGLPGSELQVITVTPAVGLTYSNFSHIAEGYYEIILTPSAAGTFSLVISASLLNHETQYVTFTLTASGIPTILTTIPSSKTVALNQTFTLQLLFQDEDFRTINSSMIVPVNPPAGVIISTATFVGDGIYNITLQSFEIGTYNLLFRATALNYQSASAGFTFDVTQIQTVLSFEGDITRTTVEYEEPYELIIYYERIDPRGPVQEAEISILPTGLTDLDISIVEYTGYYIMTIRGHQVGTWALTVIANRTDYRLATKQFFFEVEEIDTTVQGSNPLGTLLIGRPYQFTFDYIFESNSSTIRSAAIDPSGAGADWVTYTETSSGQYIVTLTPQELGNHSVSLTFGRTGFEDAYFRIIFTVGRIPITVEILQGISAPEYSQSLILVRVSETDSGDPVSDIQVFCYLIDPNGAAGSSITMIETATAGVYSAYIPMPVAEGLYQIEITCEAINYVLSSAFTAGLQPQRDFVSMVWVTTTRYYPFIIALVAIGFGLIYRRAAKKRRIRENKETLAIKRRFDDVRSLLGVIVLHKESGLPVYSKILREGLEETVISAFITAITSFRGEFDIETSSEEWGLIPISDIVRVISTNKLVCAFITTGNPSPEQREKMIQFAKTVGFIFDETMEDVPVVVLDRHTTTQFDALFDDILDGQLLRTYKLDETKKLPTTTCANERIARKHGEQFKLEELAAEIASCGIEETRVYKAIMVALENHYLVKTEESPFSTELLRASDVVVE